MSYVTPNSNIWLLAGIPLDKDYKHTWKFNTKGAQEVYFQNYKIGNDKLALRHTLPNHSYQRVDNETIKVAMLADDLNDINYMIFQNVGTAANRYSSKYYYAFVTSIEYVNEHTSLLHYKIDKMQTYMFDYELAPSFVERQHSETDAIGDNIVDEGLDTGEYIYNQKVHFDMSEQSVAVLSSTTPDTEPPEEGEINQVVADYAYNGIYNGLMIRKGLKLTSKSISFSVDYIGVGLTEKQVTIVGLPEYGDNIRRWTITSTDHNNQTATFTNDEVPEYTLTINCFYVPQTAPAKSHWRIRITEVDGETITHLVPTFDTQVTEIQPPSSGNYYIMPLTIPFGITFTPESVPPYAPDKGFSVADGSFVKTYIDSFKDPSAITNIYQYPSWIDEFIADGDMATTTTSISAFTPTGIINKKLLTYPYSYVVASNNIGTNVEYRWENTSDRTSVTNLPKLNFEIKGTLYGTPTCFLYPLNYRQLSQDYESGLTLNNFPTCAWLSDVYKTWWSQNKASATQSLAMGIISNTLSGISGAVSGGKSDGARGAISGAVTNLTSIGGSIWSYCAKKSDMKAIPPSAQGQYANDGINNGIGRTGFTLYGVTVKPQIMKIIDDYFQMFGYASKQLKVPNTHARTKFTYVKTQGCIIHPAGNMCLNGDTESDICSIFDNGITFWIPPALSSWDSDEGKYPYNIGDYYNPDNPTDATWNEPVQ